MKRSGYIQRRTPLVRGSKRIRRVSSKRAKQLREYTKLRADFLAKNPWCEVAKAFGSVPARATEVHHKAGRIGAKLNDVSHFMAVCRDGHAWIHSHPSEARARGWII